MEVQHKASGEGEGRSGSEHLPFDAAGASSSSSPPPRRTPVDRDPDRRQRMLANGEHELAHA